MLFRSSLIKELGISLKTEVKDMTVDDIKARLDSGDVESTEKTVVTAIDKRNDLKQKIDELNSLKNELELLQLLPVDLELYSGYETITSLVGTVGTDPTEALKGIDAEIFLAKIKKSDSVVAIFVKNEDRDSVSYALSGLNFKEIPVSSDAVGKPSEALAEAEAKLAETEALLEKSEAEIEGLKEKYTSFLLAAEEDLSITVEKGEIPLRIANSEYSFVVDAWVPTKNVDEVREKLMEKSDGKMHVEFLETRGRRIADSEDVESR